jgi:dTDP-D-glucose 4,6-dehydratase
MKYLVLLSLLITTAYAQVPNGGIACFAKEHALVVYGNTNNTLDFYVVHDNGTTIEQVTAKSYSRTNNNSLLVRTENSTLEMIEFENTDLSKASAKYKGKITLTFGECDKMF